MKNTARALFSFLSFVLFCGFSAYIHAEGPPPPPDTVSGRQPAPGHEPQGRRVSDIMPRRYPMSPDKLLPGMQDKALSVKGEARVLSPADEEIWKTEFDKLTIPGRPVAFKLVGKNLAMLIYFTPYLRRNKQWVLVAQGQIWLESIEKKLAYETTLQTLPVKLGEPVLYFPLGADRTGSDDSIEIRLELTPYTEQKPAGQGNEPVE